MDYYVKENSDKSVILMAEDGHALATFGSINEAITACQQDCLRNPLYVECHHHYGDLQACPEALDTHNFYVIH